jgi:hypothetical protein
MVRAILDNRKSMTRRVLKPKKGATISDCVPTGKTVGIASVLELPREMLADPKYKVGDLLWVHEAWRTDIAVNHCKPSDVSSARGVMYEADGATFITHDNPLPDKWGKQRPGMFMPRWASRITLRVTDVKVERLGEITELDARAEGIERLKSGRGFYHPLYDHGHVRIEYCNTAKLAFEILWESINGPGSWDENPWVATYRFERVK